MMVLIANGMQGEYVGSLLTGYEPCKSENPWKRLCVQDLDLRHVRRRLQVDGSTPGLRLSRAFVVAHDAENF